MNAEMLERLMIDDSLGQLSSEVSALLDAYLMGDPAARAEAEVLRRMVGVARKAAAGAVPRLPPFDRRGLERARQRRVIGRTTGWISAAAGLAACLAIGFILGHQWQRTSGPSVASDSAPKAVSVFGATARIKDGNADGDDGGGKAANGFWSTQRMRTLAQQNQASAREARSIPPLFNRLFNSPGG
jgi:hypothetical protein